MSTTRVRISPEVAAVLRAGAITEGVFRLPDGQLERKLYTDVAKVLKNLGGKWDRRVAGFPVAGEFEAALAEALGSGVAVDADREAGFFATQPEIAEIVWDHLFYQPGNLVLEPSCGTGDLLAPLFAKHSVVPGDVYAIEMNLERYLATQRRFPGINVLNKRLEVFHDEWRDGIGWRPFSCIAMNPPFGKGVEVDHINMAMDMLAEDGQLVAIAPSGIKDRSDKKTVALRRRIDVFGGYIKPLPEGSFKASGTNVNTCLVVIQ